MSFGHLLLLTLIIFIIFGVGKLPTVMEDLAKGVRAFRKGLGERDHDSHDPF